MNKIYHEVSSEKLVRSLLEDINEDFLVFNPTSEFLSQLVSELHDSSKRVSVTVIATESTIDRVTEGFVLPAKTKDLIDRGSLSIHVTDESPASSYLATDDQLFLFILLDTASAVGSTNPKLIDNVTEYFEGIFAATDPVSLRTPGLGTILDTLTDQFDEAVASDFEQAVKAASDRRGPVVPMELALLIGAKHELLLYDISKWGEDIGLASKATFSRTKTRLEDQGLLDTEKVPIDIGRPRLRLKYGPVFGEEAPESEALVQEIV